MMFEFLNVESIEHLLQYSFFIIFVCGHFFKNRFLDLLSLIIFSAIVFSQGIFYEQEKIINENFLFSHSWLPFMYQYGFGIFIFGGGLFAVFKAYGGKEFWNQYRIWIQILIWGFIYVTSIHLLMTISALNDFPLLYLVILSLYIFNVFLLTKKIT
jgi:Uncharacterized protein conserved in archaea